MLSALKHGYRFGLSRWVCAIALAPAFTLFSAQPVTLVKDGPSQMTLRTGNVSGPAAELRLYVEKISGGELPLAAADSAGPGVFVGLSRDFPSLGFLGATNLGPEGFLLKSDGNNLYLLANEPAGLQHAVTTFLQSLGCRWYFPGKIWEIVPRRPTVAGSWDTRSRPAFALQRKIWYGFGTYKSCQEEFDQWQRHNRMGGAVNVTIGHTSHGLNFTKDFAEHPEWFALVKGQRKPSKPCYSHPAVVQRATAYALEQAAGGAAMISMSPPDGLGYCECERCFRVFRGSKPVAEHGSYFATRPDGVVVNVTSETFFGFINEVAAAVARQYPGTLVGSYAYSAYSHPPSFKLHPNVFLQTTTAFRRTALTLEQQMDAWATRVSQLGIRDYYSVYQWDWDYPPAGKLEPASLQREIQFFHRKGVTSINAEASNNWGPRGLGYYLAAQLLWDVNADVPGLLRDFYERAFGPAASVMERYYARWYGPSAAVTRAPGRADFKSSAADGSDELRNDQAAAKLSLQTIKASFRDLDEAARLTRAAPACHARVDQLRLYWHYLYLRHCLDQAAATKKPEAILEAIRAELAFGGRLAFSNMIHARPLLGKGLLRRFKTFEALLARHPALEKEGQGWRQTGQPPSSEELERLWTADLDALGLSAPRD